MVEKLRLSSVWLGLAVIATALFLLIQNQWKSSLLQAQQHFVESNHVATLSELAKLETAVRSIYENIRTLASLPSVRGIGRHAENMSQEAHVTFQQIYNNLASNVAISEVYIVPIDLNPNRIDPITLKNEEPILMYDQLILNAGNGMTMANRIENPDAVAGKPFAGPPEVETHEYLQLMDHAKWLQAKYPTLTTVKGLKVPFVSGPEVITCDNSIFIRTGHDGDRSGIMFSVPFYGMDGKIKGMVSAIILTSALRDLLPSKHFALVNPGNHYANLASGAQSMKSSLTFIEEGVSDPDLIYSEVIPLSVIDSRNPWSVWSGLSNEAFLNSRDVEVANDTWSSSLLLLAAFVLAAALITVLVDRYLRQTATLAASNMRTRFFAEKSEAEARETSDKLQLLNADVSRLNSELSDKIVQLTHAQNDIIRKGKMVQLGNLVATVAHELRNPLGGVRTTAFMLRRKLKDSPVDVDAQLQRLDAGVTRCDAIITQLLDFSRTTPLERADVELESWLLKVVTETADDLPKSVAIQIEINTNGLILGIDSERLRRAMVNLLTNASEALTTKNGPDVLPDNPKIKITLREGPRGVEISVSDNGPGISSDVIEKIGEALFTTKSFGTGLGVASVRKIAELHGGGLDIASVLGHGACFTIWLPHTQSELKAA